MRVEPGPYRAFIGTLFVFIFLANWATLVPGVEPPTAHPETDAVLALLAFLAVIRFGVRAGGARGDLANFASPNLVMVASDASGCCPSMRRGCPVQPMAIHR